MVQKNPIPTYIINLKRRTDRKTHILGEFLDKEEFNITIVEAVEHQRGATGLWETIKKIISQASNSSLEYVLFCEDDHCFTQDYDKEKLYNEIQIAQGCDADVLLGGVSWFGDAIPTANSLLWIKKFWGSQFTIIFRKFYSEILEADFASTDVADGKITDLSNKKYLIYPFISTQREFGYSDVTMSNNTYGLVDKLFSDSISWINSIVTVHNHYKILKKTIDINSIKLGNDVVIPTFIIGEEDEIVKLENLLQTFSSMELFQTASIFTYRNNASSTEIWNCICSIVRKGIENGEDVLVVCNGEIDGIIKESEEHIISNIISAYYLGVDFLLGGLNGFGHMVPVSKNLIWIDRFRGGNLLILFRGVFEKIINFSFRENLSVDENLSILTCDKLVLYPFIVGFSEQNVTGLKTRGRIDENMNMYSISMRDSL